MKNIFIYGLIVLTSLGLTAQTPSGKHLIKYLENNTTQSDYGLAFLNNDKVVFAMPIDDTQKRSQSDLFVGNINDEGEISDKELIKGISHLKKVSKTGITYSSDFRTVYFSAKKDKRKKAKEKDQLFKATIDGAGNWTKIEKLPFNNDRYSTGQPTLSSDDKQLYFVSNRPSSNGGNDIFVVDINDDGSYSDPKNLGGNVNTHGDEMTPYITDDNILYFSSNGHKENLGGLDVYASHINNNTATESIHLEAPINSINDDFAYIINKNNNAGYFSSNRLQGQENNDIYSFILEEPKPEKCLQEIAGIVRDKETDEILNDAAMTLFDEEGNQIEQIVTDGNGAYQFSLDCNQTYTLVASGLYYTKDEHIINTANYSNAPSLEANKFLAKKTGAELEEALAALANGEDVNKVTLDEQTPVEEEVETNEEEVVAEETTNEPTPIDASEAAVLPVYFGFDKSNITDASAVRLDKIVALMKDNTAIEIEVSAHTDSRGSSDYNLRLSNRRAKSAIDYIVSMGVDRNRLIGKGYGESRMLNKCVNGVECSEEAHAKNRRTEFAILNTQTHNEPENNSSKQNSVIVKNENNTTKNKEQIVAKQFNTDTESETEATVSQNKLEEEPIIESTNPKVENTDLGLGDDEDLITSNNTISDELSKSDVEKIDKVSSSDTPEISKKKGYLELIKTNQAV